MPKINVYLPDDLAAAVRAADVPVSAVCQRALADAVQIVQKVRKSVTALRNPQFDPDSHPQFAARLVSRMTPRLRQALALARDASATTHLVTTRHLLLGIVDQHDNLAVRLLQSLGQDVDMIRDTAEQLDSNEPLPAAVSAATEETTPSGEASLSAETLRAAPAVRRGRPGALQPTEPSIASQARTRDPNRQLTACAATGDRPRRAPTQDLRRPQPPERRRTERRPKLAPLETR